MSKKSDVIFQKLAKYYDIIYQNKNYREEVKIIANVIKGDGQSGKNLLDLGCGTAAHDIEFSKLKYKVTGIDKSADMLRLAQKKTMAAGKKINFIEDDIVTFSLREKFDVITCLFHVVSYLTKTELLFNFFLNVEKHLKPGGIFVFDLWYGPGVLGDLPSIQYREYSDENKQTIIHRVKNPQLFVHENRVEVTHRLFVEDKVAKKWESFTETHNLRYFFFSEIEFLLQQAGLKIVRWGGLDTNFQEIGDKDWDAYFIVRKK